jgi:enoyl-[acyl-carrier-protein] reductase (NADH)
MTTENYRPVLTGKKALIVGVANDTPFARRLTGETMYVDGGVNIMA